MFQRWRRAFVGLGRKEKGGIFYDRLPPSYNGSGGKRGGNVSRELDILRFFFLLIWDQSSSSSFYLILLETPSLRRYQNIWVHREGQVNSLFPFLFHMCVHFGSEKIRRGFGCQGAEEDGRITFVYDGTYRRAGFTAQSPSKLSEKQTFSDPLFGDSLSSGRVFSN